MSKVYEDFKELFNPELRERKRAAVEAVRRNEEKIARAKLAAEVGALASNPVIKQYKDWLLNTGDAVLPDQTMDAAGAFWYRRGLQVAANMLDQILARAEEDTDA